MGMAPTKPPSQQRVRAVGGFVMRPRRTRGGHNSAGFNSSLAPNGWDFRLGLHATDRRGGGRDMSDVVSTSRALFCPGEDDPRGVAVAVQHEPAGIAPEHTVTQSES